jgi:hypothetical protein
VALGAASSGEPTDPAGIFDQRVMGAMRAVMRKPGCRRQSRRGVKHILGRATAKTLRRRRRVPPGRQSGGRLAIPGRVARQRRVGVDPAFLEADPARPQIALLDDMDADRAGTRERDRQAMQRPAIAEQDDVGDLVFHQQPVEKRRPIVQISAVVDRAR